MDIFLIKKVKKLIALWGSFSIALTLLIFLQTLFGKYGHDSVTAWNWLFINLLPVNLLILLGFFLNRRSTQQRLTGLDLTLFRVLYLFSWLYLSILLLILLLLPLFKDDDRSEAANLRSSGTGLYILQAALLLILGLFLYQTRRSLTATGEDLLPEGTGVFISYQHSDQAAARKIKSFLEKENIPVTMDISDMLPGDDIRSFIIKSIRQTRVTLSIVSRNSLLSGWVAIETADSFFLEKYTGRKRFIACYLDEDFLRLEFTSEAITGLDEKLNNINSLITKHRQMNIDTRDLNEEKTRLMDLRSRLDATIQRLRTSLCLDIRDGRLEDSLALLLKSIKNV